jgi:hypothetical protein
MAKGVAWQGVRGQQNDVEEQHKSADSNAEAPVKTESANGIAPQERKKDEARVEEIAVKILQDKGEPGLTLVAAFAWFADGAGGRIEKKCPVIGLAVVIAGDSKS